MPDNPEKPDDVDVLLRNFAASRRSFAAHTPDLHEADIRRLAEAARRERIQGAPVATGMLGRLRGLVAALSTPQWSALGAAAVLLFCFAVWLPLRERGGGSQYLTKAEPGAANQRFAMVATTFRGESDNVQDDFSQFDLDLNLDKHQMVLEFRDGSVLTGTLQPDAGSNPTTGSPLSFAVNSAGADSHHLPIGFKGVLVAVQDPAAPGRATQVSLRGILTANQREIQFTAGIKQP